jgi:hypothetical protein
MFDLLSLAVGAAAATAYLVVGLVAVVRALDSCPRDPGTALALLAWLAWPVAAPAYCLVSRRRRRRTA